MNVPLQNLEVSERKGIILSPAMLISLAAVFATCLRSSVRALHCSWKLGATTSDRRAATFREKEAPQHDSSGPPLGLAILGLEGLALGAGYRSTPNGHRLAPCWLSAFLGHGRCDVAGGDAPRFLVRFAI